MAKTIRLLSTYNGFKRGDIITVDDAVADQLLPFNASLDLTGGTPAFRPSQGSGLSSGSNLPANQTITAGQTADVTVPSGVSLGVNGTSDIAGTWSVVNPDGTTATPTALVSGNSTVGVFIVDTKVRFNVTFGTLIVKPGVVAGSLTSSPLYFVPIDPATGQPYKITGGGGTGGTFEEASAGPVAPGVAAAKSSLAGGVFSSTLPTLTDGQQTAARIGQRGQSLSTVIDPANAAAAQVFSASSDGRGAATLGLAAQSIGYVFNGTSLDRMRGDAKGLYTKPSDPDNVTGSVTAQTVSGTSVAAASLIATIDNPGMRYKKLILYVKNNSAVAFTDLVLRTRCIPADTTYDINYTSADDYTKPKGLLTEVTINPVGMANGETRLKIDITDIASLQVAAAVASGSTTAIARWILVAA